MKKFLTILLTVVLTAAVAITGTVAYLTAEDSDVNTMTFGNVKIDQHEYERNEAGEIVDFTQDKPLYPYVGELGWKQTDDNAWREFTMNNVVDKYVTVKNTGVSDAYVRTYFAFEMGKYETLDEFYKAGVGASTNAANGAEFQFDGAWVWGEEYVAEIDGQKYNVMVATHINPVKPGEETIPSLLQVYLDKTADYEDCEALDGNGNGRYDILVFSQAVQVKGFEEDGAEKALETAFGNEHPWVGENVPVIPGVINSVEKLQAALDNAVNGDVITLGADIEGDVTVTQKADTKITIDGNGKTFAGVLTVDGKSATYLTAGLTVKNVNFKADSISADACIRLGNGTNATRYTCNVTVENCTFDVPGAVGVKSYTGGDKNLVIRNCTATASAHSLVQAKGIDGVLVEGCKVYSKNGLNFNNSDNVTVDNCTVDVKGYAVRFGESSGGVGAAETYLIKNSSLKSANDDGDAVIILRGTADYSTLTIENTTITGTPDITNNAAGATVVK